MPSQQFSTLSNRQFQWGIYHLQKRRVCLARVDFVAPKHAFHSRHQTLCRLYKRSCSHLCVPSRHSNFSTRPKCFLGSLLMVSRKLYTRNNSDQLSGKNPPTISSIHLTPPRENTNHLLMRFAQPHDLSRHRHEFRQYVPDTL